MTLKNFENCIKNKNCNILPMVLREMEVRLKPIDGLHELRSAGSEFSTDFESNLFSQMVSITPFLKFG